MAADDRGQDPLAAVGVSRRSVVKSALTASAVAVPVITSVALGGAVPAYAHAPDISGQTTTVGPTTTPATTTPGPEDGTTTPSPEDGATTSTTGPVTSTTAEPTTPEPTTPEPTTPEPTTDPLPPPLPPVIS